MESEPSTFPPHPVRGVRAVYARQSSCPSDFAEVTVDFEPWEDGIVFEVAADLATHGHIAPDELTAYRTALAAGVREELAQSGGTTPAVAVVLRGIRVHEVDSRPGSFRAAGRIAVRNALVHVHGPPPRPKRRRT
jgi:translation elongation factor EF-G